MTPQMTESTEGSVPGLRCACYECLREGSSCLKPVGPFEELCANFTCPDPPSTLLSILSRDLLLKSRTPVCRYQEGRGTLLYHGVIYHTAFTSPALS